MAGLCKVIVIGNLGRDPEKRYTQDGRPVTRFSVAATTRRRERDGEWADHTEWFSVTVFGRQAETLAERVAKGTRVYVEGRLESRQYDTQTGGKGFSLDVVANEVVVLDSRQRAEGDFGSGDLESAVPAPTRGDVPRPMPREDATDLEDLPF
ncbi:MAG TPA: single-stranded DNA-binding protein [Chloroflexota bacterium]